MVALTDIRNSDWIEAYRAVAPAIIERHGGEYLAVGTAPELLEGPGDAPSAVTMFRFPTLEAIRAFLDSEDYRPLKELRLTGSSSRILAFESMI
jgi:uncharacterized protein (DUF1330 family)